MNVASKKLAVGTRLLAIVVVAMLVATSCSSSGEVAQEPTPTPGSGNGGDTPDDDVVLAATTASGPRSIRLSQGSAAGGSTEADPVAVVEGTALSESEVAQIAERLGPWDSNDDSGQVEFNRPPETLRPPLVGETIESTFPASLDTDGPDEVEAGPLEVLRFQPEGAVEIAPTVSITFNQPMVPLATLDQLDEIEAPATISPDLPGRWEWIGAKTLRFEHDSDLIDRLPMATDYTVTIPGGTTSETGGELAETVTFEFTTPTVSVTSFTPGSGSQQLPLEPVFVAHFDQRIDQDAVLGTISLTADGDNYDLRLATDEEIASDETASRSVGRATDGRFVAFRATTAFEPDTAIEVRVGPNTPSAEGPRTSASSETFESRTFGPLRVDDQNCDSGDTCRPFESLWINFTNQLDAEAFDPTAITIEPELRGAVITTSGSTIQIRGLTTGDTEYKVTVPASLTDVWGQTLGDNETLKFKIGESLPALAPFPRQFITTDPYVETPTVAVTSLNHDKLRVQIYEVDPSDYAQFDDAQYRFDDPDYDFPNWPEVYDETVDTDANDDELTETAIDLSDALDGEYGHLVVLVSSTLDLNRNDDAYWSNRPTIAWVQVTDIGIDAFSDQDEVVFWATDLATGAPLADVELSLDNSRSAVTTDAEGLATTDLPSTAARMIVATKGDDTAMLPWFGEAQRSRDQARWHIFDDRGMYRPGETVHLKGWVRKLTTATDAQVVLPSSNGTISYLTYDPQGNEIAAGEASLNPLGGFDFEIDLPEESNLGWAYVELQLAGAGISDNTYASHSFQVQEFRRPEFEVAARTESEGPYLQTEPATVAVDANYFSGGPLPNAEVNWLVTTSETSYRPPNWTDFTFGIWTPWWFYGGYYDTGFGGEDFYEEPYYEDDYYDDDIGYPGGQNQTVQEFSGLTDATGTHYLQVDFDGDQTDQPATVNAAATVYDVNRQAWGSATSMLVHPADYYVGLRTDTTFVAQGEPLEISAVVTDIDGAAVAGRDLLVEAQLLEWKQIKGEWQEVIADSQTCELTTESEPAQCSFDTASGGEYRVTSTVLDDKERPQRSELTVWVAGGKQRPNRQLEQEELTLIPDAELYEPGGKAQVLVQAPFEAGEGLLTVARNGIQYTERFEVVDYTAILTVDIADEHIPNLDVQVDVVGSTERTNDNGESVEGLPPRPAFASGRLTLQVPPVSRTLNVETTPESDEVKPGEDTTVAVTVTNAEGAPVEGAEFAVIVVDEAVLALSNYQLADPVNSFYSQIASRLRSDYLRRSVILENPLALLGQGEGPLPTPQATGADFAEGDDGAAMADMEESAPEAEASRAASPGETGPDAIDVRTNFDALALFEPEVTTGADGTAVVDVPMPDSLTRYRVMVVAVDGDDQFGSGEANITARLPLQVRPSAPRFLNFGDTFEFPVVVQNQTDEAMDVDVVLQTTNLDLVSFNGTTVNVPANDRVEVRFPAAAVSAGTAAYRVAAVSGNEADAATNELPVYTPATAEAFATYGVVDGDDAVLQPLLAPADVWPQFGGLEIGTSSTALQALTDAVIYISQYRYSSADAHASRILAITALRDVLEAFDAEGLPTPSELNEAVQADIDAIVGLQNDDGGWPIWRRYEQSWSYHTVHVAHALVEADNNGYDVPTRTLDAALEYLRNVEDRFYPVPMSQGTKDAISSYALHVRHLSGDTDEAKANTLYAQRGNELSLESLAWIWPVISDAQADTEIERTFNNRATETAAAATFTDSYGDDAYTILHSSRRSDGIILDALISERPSSDLIPKVVAGLLGNQTRGRWDNMQENTFILLALNNYFDTFEAEDPDFVARVWLGQTYAAEHEYRGRSTDRNETLVPMQVLVDEGDTDLVLAKDGDAGRLYYRLGLRYAPSDLDLEPRDRGFEVARTYEAVGDASDVSQDSDGTWRIAAGAEVRVRVTMVADSRRTHVALIDPLPAGLEPLNPALAVTPEVAPDDNAASTYWYWRWFGHQNLRDDRAEAFTTYLRAGIYEYSYVARATTPGTFVTPPARAEEMYAPETFGRSSTDMVIVE